MSLLENFIEGINVWGIILLPRIICALAVFLIGWCVATKLTKIVKCAMFHANIEKGIIFFTCSFCKIILRIIVFILLLNVLGIDTSALIATLGIGAVAIGFAIKDSLSNITSGFLIIINKPFKVGDYLKIENFEGTVAKIEIFFTTLLTTDNKEIVLPNSNITTKNITNYNIRKTRRLNLSFFIGYETDLQNAKRALIELAMSHDLVLKVPEPVVAISEYRETNMKLTLKLWCHSDNYEKLQASVQESIKNLFDEKILLLGAVPQV